jgi:transaldolase
VSLEVFAGDFAEMIREAKVIASWGPNVNVKIPVTNTRREFSGPVIRELLNIKWAGRAPAGPARS